MDYYVGSDLLNHVHIVSSIEDTISLCGRHIGRPEFTVSSSLTSLTTLITETVGGCRRCVSILVDGEDMTGNMEARYERKLKESRK